MGQKVNPISMRLGSFKEPYAKWFADNKKEFANTLNNDLKARKFLKKKFGDNAAISKIKIERPSKNMMNIVISSGRPGVLIGKKGEGISTLSSELSGDIGIPVHITIEEIRKPDTDAQLIAELIAKQLEQRVTFRRAMKKAVQSALRGGVQGIKVCVSGRLGGTDIARTEWYREGRVPLHTLKANIDYGFAEAQTTYGIIGVKTWVCHGEEMAEEETGKSGVKSKYKQE
jgi:small subunit ribosomal protein S3